MDEVDGACVPYDLHKPGSADPQAFPEESGPQVSHLNTALQFAKIQVLEMMSLTPQQ